jgi:hypothetical protein
MPKAFDPTVLTGRLELLEQRSEEQAALAVKDREQVHVQAQAAKMLAAEVTAAVVAAADEKKRRG